jgi:hypothetical protein
MEKRLLRQVRVDPELDRLITAASEENRLTESEVIRQALSLGLPQLRERLRRPRHTLIELLDKFAELDLKPDRSLVRPSRLR